MNLALYSCVIHSRVLKCIYSIFKILEGKSNSCDARYNLDTVPLLCSFFAQLVELNRELEVRNVLGTLKAFACQNGKHNELLRMLWENRGTYK